MIDMSYIDSIYQEPPDEWDLYADLAELDRQWIWRTKSGEEIEYDKLETSHIQNIIKKLKVERHNMPNLFKELRIREALKKRIDD
jgi:hypothetical protein